MEGKYIALIILLVIVIFIAIFTLGFKTNMKATQQNSTKNYSNTKSQNQSVPLCPCISKSQFGYIFENNSEVIANPTYTAINTSGNSTLPDVSSRPAPQSLSGSITESWTSTYVSYSTKPASASSAIENIYQSSNSSGIFKYIKSYQASVAGANQTHVVTSNDFVYSYISITMPVSNQRYFFFVEYKYATGHVASLQIVSNETIQQPNLIADLVNSTM